MAIKLTLPMGEKDNVKNLVFTILSHEYPLKLIQLTNYIRKRYGKSVTFQAVRKAVIQLVKEGVLEKADNEFKISTDWIRESKKIIDNLYEGLTSKKQKKASVESVGEDVSVFSFDSVNSLMKLWQEIIDDWFKKFESSDYPVNCYQAGHVWEVLLHLETEEKIMGQMKKKGIKPYAVITSNTPLDKSIAKFYNKIGVKTTINSSKSDFDKAYYVGTYGDMIVQTNYPKSIVNSLDEFFKKNKNLKDLDISELSHIVNKKVQIKLTVIKNLEMAKQINKNIFDQFVN